MKWLRRLLSLRPTRAELIVMRLADMERVHPEQIVATCSSCGHEVGVYPSGQKIMRKIRGVKLVCQVCRTPGDGGAAVVLAPGALEERKQSVWKQ